VEVKRYHHGDLKRTLIEVADHELAEHGYEGLSLRSVAKRAGVSHTAPYRHFADKSSLLTSLVIHSYQKLETHLEEVEWRFPDDLQGQLKAFASTFISVVTRNPRKAQFMFSRPMADEDADMVLTSVKNQIVLKLHELCAAAQTRGEIKQAKTIATAYWSALVGLGVLISSQDPALQYKTVEDLQALAEDVTSSLF
jgi:AcrR family transcriptional regulator